MSDSKWQMLFRGGPIDGMNVTWPYGDPPAELKGFLTTSPADLTVPPVGSKDLQVYHRTEWFVCDVAPSVKAVIYVWQRK